MEEISVGDLVFAPCADITDVAFAPGSIISKAGGIVDVRLEDTGSSNVSQVRSVPLGEIRHRFARSGSSTSADNTSLIHMNDATILENLQLRHSQDEIYTYTASVLLAMNPYKSIDGLYGDSQCELYRGKHIGALPPHPYAIADTAYRALVREQRNQGLLISGESGAGKTETAKIVMQFLAYTSGAACDLATQIQGRVLRAQPILESFGNAVTLRNSNSSRFGKYNRMFFNGSGTLVDAGITTYLLESSRVVFHGERERTYHVFYEMLSGLSQGELEEFHLERNGKYRLMYAFEPVDGLAERDSNNFRRLKDALKTVGLSEVRVHEIFKVLAGLVHLADIPRDADQPPKGKSDDDASNVDVVTSSVEHAAALLGMDPEELIDNLSFKKIQIRGRSSFHKAPRSATQFRQALHSLIKALYKRLFERTVQAINNSFLELRPGKDSGTPSLSTCESEWSHIGILDIYGFERLQKNSFEQLCINLANERLQQYFVENVLVAEQNLYAREGLPWTGLNLPDSQPVVDCISHVFRSLDDFSSRLAKGFDNVVDEKFCEKTLEEAFKDPQRKDILGRLKMQGGRRNSAAPALNDGFTIKHYAGIVEYTTKGWLDKNNDRLLMECEELICTSTCPLVQSLAEEDQAKTPFRSISKKYVSDLEALLQTLSTCNLHYIRCFKPNDQQKPHIFKQQLVLDQIVQCGTIELVKIMHDGYPNRCPFDEITSRFRELLPENFRRYGMRTFIEALMLAYEVPREEWALGMSRLFLKAGQLRMLESMRSEGTMPKAEKLAKIVTGIIRRRWISAIHAVRLCQWLPKLLEQIRLRKLQARRRFRGAYIAVSFASDGWRRIKKNRLQRLTTTMFRVCFILARTKPWVAAAKQRVAETQKQAEAEMKRIEAERQALQEERRRAEEARRAEEERRQIEEKQRRIEEERRLAQEHQQQETAKQQREAEQQRMENEMREKLEEEKRILKEKMEHEFALERQKFEDERKALAEERRVSILKLPTPQHKSLADEITSAEQGQNAAWDADERSAVTLQASTIAGEEEESDVGDSVSQYVHPQDVQAMVQKEIGDQMLQLQKEMQRREEEVMRQMQMLQQKNERLEKQLGKERGTKSSGGHNSGERTPIRQDGRDAIAEILSTPPSSSSRGTGKRGSVTTSRSAKRFSLISPVSARVSNTSKAPGHTARNSMVVQEALFSRSGGGDTSRRVSEAACPDGNLNLKRRWWAEQRDFLVQDLYPHGSPRMPGMHTLNSARNTGRRRTQTGDIPASVLENEVLDSRAPRSSTNRAPEAVERNLCNMFDSADEPDPIQ